VTAADRKRTLLHFALASAAAVGGVVAAAAQFPGGFDWVYMVISKLGSRTQNPAGGVWLSVALIASVLLLWPVSRVLASASSPGDRPRVAAAVLRLGLVGGVVLGVEGLFGLELSRLGRKAHEIVALLTFLGLYGGVLGLFIHRAQRSAAFLVPALLVLLPLCAVAITQLMLYLGQRDLGWVNVSWRELGVPFWLSFAFWQWLAVAFLGLGIGVLVLARVTEPASPTATMTP
jgi:hypothetical protein